MRKLFILLSTVMLIFFASAQTEILHVAENDGIEVHDVEFNDVIYSDDVAAPDDVNFSDDKTVTEMPLQELKLSNWWENNFLTAIGHGTAPQGENVTRRTKALAKRSAMMDGYRNLAERIGEIQITAEKNLVKRKIDAVINFAEVVAESYDENGNCTVVLRIPIYGANSFAEVALKPVHKKNFPKPTEDKIATGNYTGLVIDCGDAEINPVLSPEIRNAKNKSIYSYANLDRDKVVAHGMVSYTQKNFADEQVILTSTNGKKFFTQAGSKIFLADEAEVNSRVGDNPLVIKAAKLSEDDSCPVISTDDADKILAENEVSHFLDDGAVVFTSKRIRGMRL